MFERILTEVAATPWMIEPGKGRQLAAILTRRANGVKASEEDLAAVRGTAAARKSAVRRPAGSVALIPLIGVMTQRADLFADVSGMASTEAVGRAVDEAVADPGVEAIVLDVDSPGGSVFGTRELADKVYEAAKKKKVVAVANSIAASGAYYVASQASELVVTPSGTVGSIGVVMMNVDRTKQLEEAGLLVTVVSAGERKTVGYEEVPLTADGRAEMQGMVDGWYDQFVKTVARGRNVSQAKVRDGFGKGGMLLAEAAVKEGMADRVATLEQTLARFGASATVAASAAGKDFDVELRKRKLLLG